MNPSDAVYSAGVVPGTVIRLYSGGSVKVIRQVDADNFLVLSCDEASAQQYFCMRWFSGNKAADSLYAMLIALLGSGSPGGMFAWLIAVTKRHDGGFGYLYTMPRAGVHLDISPLLTGFLRPISQTAQLGYQVLSEYIDLFDDTLPLARLSLAMMLFILCHGANPFEGRGCIARFDVSKIDLKRRRARVYIYSRRNVKNRPLPGLHTNAVFSMHSYSSELRRLFSHAFEGSAAQRPYAVVWREAFLRLLKQVYFCSHCNREVLLIPPYESCSSCHTAIENMLMLSLGEELIPLSKVTLLLGVQIGYNEEGDAVLGRVVSGSRDKERLGLMNQSQSIWYYRYAEDNEIFSLAPNKVAEIRPGMQIAFSGGMKETPKYGEVITL